MVPAQIVSAHFKSYPPEARELAIRNISLLQRLPLAFAPLLIQQIQQYDWLFPAERREIDEQLSYLESCADEKRDRLLAGFARLDLSNLKAGAWVSSPGEFSEQLSGYLWSTHQIDAFRLATSRYFEEIRAAVPLPPLLTRRLGIAVIGKGAGQTPYPLFRKLRPHGTRFTRLDPANGLSILLKAAEARAESHPAAFAHWYIEGGAEEAISTPSLVRVSYGGLEPVRRALLRRIDAALSGGVSGPESLASMLRKLRPEDIGLPGKQGEEVLNRFETSILADRSGTQIFSTTFVQWTTRELWRRAQPLTILARFAPRQRQRSMNELLSGKGETAEADVMGSLVDADMGAYYMWIEQQRLSGSQEASFIAWFEDHSEALVISPALPRNAESSNPVDMKWLVGQVT